MTSFTSDNRIVTSVRVVVHTTGSWPNGMSDNHWSIYLLLQTDSSVRMNMTAELDDPEGSLVLSSLGYGLTTSAIRNWDYPTTPGASVAQIYQLLLSKGRDQYSMSGGGSGCRWWV